MDSRFSEPQGQVGLSQQRKLGTKDLVRLKENVEVAFSGVDWCLSLDGKKVRKPARLLGILETFSKWISIEDGLRKMAEGCCDKGAFLSVSADFHHLLKEGFLEFRDSVPMNFGFHDARFDSFPVHVGLLNDTARVLAFQRAIRETVTPEDIVLDIGTGNGILAATAAMCGAKQVYAIERTDFIEVARAVFESNGLGDRITLIKGNSLKVELPRKATLLVSEIIGNDPYEEGVLHIFRDAKSRLLAPNARIIPRELRIFLQAVEAPAGKYNQGMVSEVNIAAWKENYNVDFSAFLGYVDEKPVMKNLGNEELKGCNLLSEAVEVSKVNFHDEGFSDNDFNGELVICRNGNLNGVIIYFEAELSKGNVLSLSPDKVSSSNSWSNRCYFLPVSKTVSKGETVRFSVGKLTKEGKRPLNVSYD